MRRRRRGSGGLVRWSSHSERKGVLLVDHAFPGVGARHGEDPIAVTVRVQWDDGPRARSTHGHGNGPDLAAVSVFRSPTTANFPLLPVHRRPALRLTGG